MLKDNMPVWHDSLDAIMPPPPAHKVEWLETQVLSKALKQVVPNVGLNLIHQAIGQPHPDEAQKLNLTPTHGLPLIRQVKIGTPDLTNLYCRVIVHPMLYQQEQDTFDTLGTRFIGETLLYNQPQVTRSAFEYATLTPKHALYQEAKQHSHPYLSTLDTTLYTRRSVFYLPTLPLLITEVFVHVVSPS
jgi:chorismate-pyruvate lyase